MDDMLYIKILEALYKNGVGNNLDILPIIKGNSKLKKNNEIEDYIRLIIINGHLKINEWDVGSYINSSITTKGYEFLISQSLNTKTQESLKTQKIYSAVSIFLAFVSIITSVIISHNSLSVSDVQKIVEPYKSQLNLQKQEIKTISNSLHIK